MKFSSAMMTQKLPLGASAAIPVTKKATTTIPIVMASGGADPVGLGYVASLARPGGYITGVSASTADTSPEQLELLTKLVPDATRIGIIINRSNATHQARLPVVQLATEQLRRAAIPVEVLDRDGMAGAFAHLAEQRVGAVMVFSHALFFSNREQLASLTLKYRLPTMFAQNEYVEAGGLMSYGESLGEFYRRSVYYIDRIFKGTPPADLPVQQPT